MNRIKRRVTAFVAAVTLLPALAGCYNGFNSQTSTQPPSGDGASTSVGSIQIRSATWVRSAKDPRTMTLSSNFVNVGRTPDVLTSVATVPKATVLGITGSKIDLPPISETRVGFNATLYINGYGVDVPVSGYVQTTFNFRTAGAVTVSILIVPPTGNYAGIEPVPAQIDPVREPIVKRSLRARATASATATPTPQAS